MRNASSSLGPAIWSQCAGFTIESFDLISNHYVLTTSQLQYYRVSAKNKNPQTQ